MAIQVMDIQNTKILREILRIPLMSKKKSEMIILSKFNFHYVDHRTTIQNKQKSSCVYLYINFVTSVCKNIARSFL